MTAMKLAFDVRLRRPADPVLNTVLGGDEEAAIQFPPGSWLTEITDDLRVIEVTSSELLGLIARAEEDLSALDHRELIHS